MGVEGEGDGRGRRGGEEGERKGKQDEPLTRILNPPQQIYSFSTRSSSFPIKTPLIQVPQPRATIWNELPARLKDPSLSFDSFRKLLKTFLFDK